MVGLDHGSGSYVETETAATSARNSRHGLRLFALYLLAYVAFVLLNAFAPAFMEAVVFQGVNLAVVYGLALILLAFGLALLYGFLCRSPAN
ncbi:MAG: hypothetical protein RLY70_4487 [Planctomycetota bacterium]|jgi:uncharacterized membrane protein (DUF485 family)